MDWRDVIKSHKIWVIIIVAFLLLMTVLDDDNLIDRHRVNRSIKDLERQRDYFHARIVEDSTLLENLRNDAFLEQYARENFRMKRAGETVYLIEEK